MKVTLGRPQDVIFQLPKDVSRGRPRDACRGHLLALHREVVSGNLFEKE